MNLNDIVTDAKVGNTPDHVLVEQGGRLEGGKDVYHGSLMGVPVSFDRTAAREFIASVVDVELVEMAESW